MNNSFRPHPKPKKKSKSKKTTQEDLGHMASVKELPCACCDAEPPSIAHHIVKSFKRLGHKFTIPLCDRHHEDELGRFKGKNSIGKDKKGFIKAFGTEESLLLITWDKLNYIPTEEELRKIGC